MSMTRIYVVLQKGTADQDGHRLVEATSAAQAIRHCAQAQYEVKAAQPKDVAALMSSGVQIEKAVEAPTAKHTQHTTQTN